MDASGPVLLFDGECGLCVRCVRLLAKADRSRRLRYAPLQSQAAQEFLRARGLPAADFESIVFVPDWSRRWVVAPLVWTDAVCAAMAFAEGWLSLVRWLRIVPRGWRDVAYRCVSRGRQRLFGRGDGDGLLIELGAERFVLSPQETTRRAETK